MLESAIFDPREQVHKQPYGAVPFGTAVRFFAGRPGAEVTGCTLVLHEEFAGRDTTLPLTAEGDGFCGILTAPNTPELIFYTLCFSLADGGARHYGAAGFVDDDADVPPFQLTVYDGASITPDWFGRGVSYQIFPDRFCRLGVPDPTGMIGSRTVHRDWLEPMSYLPEDGVVTNRDFYGGSLKGIVSRLDYLATLSVTTLYLNPIFEAGSNHRYDTCDYCRIDPMLGTEADFRLLCAEAKKRGMRVVLDGVFNHTGNGSRYFNARGWYDTVGAAQSRESPWYSWYHFDHWPDRYSSWWGIDTLPQVEESEPSYIDYIIENKDSVIRRWLRAGASGWRLDVADELPDSFIQKLRAAAVAEKSDAVIIGEVWEDGSNKIAYGQRRKYLLGSETHGLMNYPFRVSAIAWLCGGDAAAFYETMETIREHYPPAAFYSAMNSLGTHDTPRVLTLLGQEEDLSQKDRSYRAGYRLDYAGRERAIRRLRLGAALLYTFPGSPTVFYGDEAGMEGCEDPFNRGPYPWGREEPRLLALYRTLGALRRTRLSLQIGTIEYLLAEGGVLVFRRTTAGESTLIALNNGDAPYALTYPWDGRMATDALSGQKFLVRDGTLHLTVPPVSGVVLI